jgi:hypothetical protein
VAALRGGIVIQRIGDDRTSEILLLLARPLDAAEANAFFFRDGFDVFEQVVDGFMRIGGNPPYPLRPIDKPDRARRWESE